MFSESVQNAEQTLICLINDSSSRSTRGFVSRQRFVCLSRAVSPGPSLDNERTVHGKSAFNLQSERLLVLAHHLHIT